MDKYTDELLFRVIKKAVELGIVEKNEVPLDQYMVTYAKFETLVRFILEETS